MIIVADTSPLNYLVIIDAVAVLPTIYGRVIVPQAVAQELQHPRAPASVRNWISSPAAWLEVRPDPPLDATLDIHDPGESAAIALAQLLNAQLLIDDLAGRIEAERRKLRVTGTLGVLVDAHLEGLLDFEQALARLRSTNFRLDPELERWARERISAEQEE